MRISTSMRLPRRHSGFIRCERKHQDITNKNEQSIRRRDRIAYARPAWARRVQRAIVRACVQGCVRETLFYSRFYSLRTQRYHCNREANTRSLTLRETPFYSRGLFAYSAAIEIAWLIATTIRETCILGSSGC